MIEWILWGIYGLGYLIACPALVPWAMRQGTPRGGKPYCHLGEDKEICMREHPSVCGRADPLPEELTPEYAVFTAFMAIFWPLMLPAMWTMFSHNHLPEIPQPKRPDYEQIDRLDRQIFKELD